MKKILIGLLSGFFLFSNAVGVAATIKIEEGKDYTLVKEPILKSIEPKGKVNVKEFFSFVCIHCKDIEPLLGKTITSNPKIDFNRIHVVWEGSSFSGLAKLNATIDLLRLSQLYIPVFEAMANRQDLNDMTNLKKFLQKNGIKDTDKFIQTYNSFTVASKVAEYKKLFDQYNITGTPTFIIADKYVAAPALPNRLVQVVQALIEKASNEDATKIVKK